MINSRYVEIWRRSLAPFVLMLLLLLIAYQPANSTFHSTGDVQLYQRYGTQALQRPIELPREYPGLSAVLFVLPQLVLPEQYMLSFAVLMMIAAGLTLMIVERLSRRGMRLALYIALGGWATVFFRYDIVVVLITVIAFWAGSRHRWMMAQVLLGLGAALKLYPLILMPLVVLWQWRVEQRLPWSAVLVGGSAVLFVAGAMWLLTPAATLEMLRLLRERPIQLEAVAASLAWLVGPTATELSYGSINIVSPLVPWLIPVLTPLTLITLLGVYVGVWRGYLQPASAWALALGALMLTSKVFSTQYLLWLLPFVVLAQAETDMLTSDKISDDVWLWAVICGLTSLGFPISEEYWSRTVQLGIVTVRNALLIVGLLRLAWRTSDHAFIIRCWYALADELRFWRERLGVLAALAVCLLVMNVVMLRAFSGQLTLLDIGAWNDEEMMRYRGMYQQETNEQSTTYRWTSDWSTIRINTASATAQPLMTLLLGGVPATAAVPRLVALTTDNEATVTMAATSSPRRYHFLLPSAALADGKLELLLQSSTSQTSPDPRELGVRLDALTISAFGRWPLPTALTIVVQLCAILTATAVVRRAGIRAFGQILVAVVLIVVLTVVAGSFMMLAIAWQSRLLVVCCLCLIVACSARQRQTLV